MTEAEKNKKLKKKRRVKRVRKLIIWLILLLLLAGAFYLFLLPDLKASATATYDTYTATNGSISNSLSFSGSISVVNDETMTADAAATVRKIYVAEGDSVKQGDKLIRLSDGELFRADFDGEVNAVDVEEDDDVSADASLVQVVDFTNLKVSIRVDEYSVSSLSIGQACTITVTALDKSFDSTITHINRISSNGNNSVYYTATAEFTGTESVLPGMQVTVEIPENEADNVVILNQSALSFDNGNNAYVLMKDENGDMKQVTVKLGVENDKFVEITSGLSDGDTVYVKTASASTTASGLASLFSSLTGGTQATTGTMPSGGTMPSMPSGFTGGGDFSGGGFPGGGN
jgi:multidrug efflux pump subunit AcrA (membrane-fusion protein)